MLHRKIVQPVLESLEGERADYFHRLIERLEADKRVEPVANLVFLSLKETIPYLPIYLPVAELAEALFAFVERNRRRLNEVIFDPAYVEGKEELREITNAFVTETLAAILEKYGEAEMEPEQQTAYRFSGDFDDSDFPYRDPDGD